MVAGWVDSAGVPYVLEFGLRLGDWYFGRPVVVQNNAPPPAGGSGGEHPRQFYRVTASDVEAGFLPATAYAINLWEYNELAFGGLGDADWDGDGKSNLEEMLGGTPFLPLDSDDDGFSDEYEMAKGTDPASDASTPPAVFRFRVLPKEASFLHEVETVLDAGGNRTEVPGTTGELGYYVRNLYDGGREVSYSGYPMTFAEGDLDSRGFPTDPFSAQHFTTAGGTETFGSYSWVPWAYGSWYYFHSVRPSYASTLIHERYWLEVAPAPQFETGAFFIATPEREAPFATASEIEAARVHGFSVSAGNHFSAPVDLAVGFEHDAPLHAVEPGEPWESFIGIETITLDATAAIRLPEVIPANTDFDEGRVDPATGFAIPDAHDVGGSLIAVRDHPVEPVSAGQIVTDDLLEGWFGIRPPDVDPGLFDGASVTIRKVPGEDPDSGLPQSGDIRFYALWSDGETQHAEAIHPYNLDTLQPSELVGRVYGSTATIPSDATTYYIEGVNPGLVTLEFRFTRGEISQSFRQTVLVATQQTKVAWLREIRSQILLQTSAAGAAVDLDHYVGYGADWAPRVDPVFGGDSFQWHKGRVAAIYDYYGQLFEQRPEEFDWMGAARMVGGSVYGGLSDLFKSGAHIISRKVMGGQILIYRDLAWQHRAYQASGIWALRWVDQNDPASVNAIAGQSALELEVWEDYDNAIYTGAFDHVAEATRNLVRREQEEVIEPMWAELRTGHPLFVAAAPGKARNPVDFGSPTFLQVVPEGNIDLYLDRDRFAFGWAGNPNGVFPVWWGTVQHSGGASFGPPDRLSLVRVPLRDRATLYAELTPVL